MFGKGKIEKNQISNEKRRIPLNGNGKVMSSNHVNIHRGIQMMLSEMWECAARSTHHRHERDEL